MITLAVLFIFIVAIIIGCALFIVLGPGLLLLALDITILVLIFKGIAWLFKRRKRDLN